MKRLRLPVVSLAAASLVVAVGCSSSAPAPTPTSVPASKAAEPTKPAAPAAKKLDWPQKGRTMTILVPYAAGGATDIQARLLAVPLEKELGIPVQVVNKAGAATQIGATELVTNTKPDGYTLYANELPTTIMTYLDPSRKAVYTRKDFQTVAGHVLDPQGMAVKASSPIKNLKDLVDMAKANPGQARLGTTGAGTGSHLNMVALEKQGGVKFNFVHFDGNAPATTALLGEHVTCVGMSSAAVMSQVKSSEIRLIAVFSKEESPFYPGVKSAQQQGFDLWGVTSRAWVVKAGTPREIVDYLSSTIKKIIETDSELKKKMDDAALMQKYMTPEEYDTYWANEEARFKPLLEEYLKKGGN